MLVFKMRSAISILLLTFSLSLNATLVMKPTFDGDLIYDNSILEGDYTSSISKPEEFLGFEIGERIATPLQITNSLEAWSEQSDRINIIEYARSHENRPLHAVFISTPENLNRLEDIKEDLRKISDARLINDS